MATCIKRVEAHVALIESANSIPDRDQAAQTMLSSMQKLNCGPLYGNDSEIYSDKFYTEMEIAFREETMRITEGISLDKENGMSDAIAFLDFVVKFAILEEKIAESNQRSCHMGKLPFILLEDMIEGQTINNFRLIWEWLESIRTEIFNAGLLVKGRIILLRMCNLLLRQLSKTYDANLAGRVLAFLASSHGLNERSGVNIGGHKNINSITYFESLEDFNTAQTELKRNDDITVEEENPQGAVDYILYESFWGLQKVFMNPETVSASAETWNNFMSQAQRVLDVLRRGEVRTKNISETLTVPAYCRQSIIRTIYNGTATLRALNRAKDEAKNVDMNVVNDAHRSFYSCKYLTSSRLFHLQLRDAQVRLQVLTQMLMFVKSFAVPLAMRTGPSPVPKNVAHDLSMLSRKIRKLLEMFTPLEQDYFKYAARALQREENWELWKHTDSCKSFERSFSVPAVAKRKVRAKKLKDPKPQKRHHCEIVPTVGEEIKFATFHPDLSINGPNSTFKKPKLEEHFEFLEECLIPDSGVEDEYMPTKDEKYNWQSRRLLVDAHLDIIDSMPTGDVVSGLDALKRKSGILPPPPPPKRQPIVPTEPEREDGEMPDF